MERDRRSNTSDEFDILIWGSWPWSGYEELNRVFGWDVAQSMSSSSRRLLVDTLTAVSPVKWRPL
jgi:hypothetical protein